MNHIHRDNLPEWTWQRDSPVLSRQIQRSCTLVILGNVQLGCQRYHLNSFEAALLLVSTPHNSVEKPSHAMYPSNLNDWPPPQKSLSSSKNSQSHLPLDIANTHAFPGSPQTHRK